MGEIQNAAWRRLRDVLLKQARFESAPCALCGGVISYELTGRDPMAPSIDHIVPRSAGGSLLDPANCRVSHYGCNSRRGARQSQGRQRSALEELLAMGTAPPSRVW